MRRRVAVRELESSNPRVFYRRAFFYWRDPGSLESVRVQQITKNGPN